MTVSGVILLPLMLLLSMLGPGMVMLGCFLFAIFADAAIANLGGISIPVGWSFAVLVIARVGLNIAFFGGRVRPELVTAVMPLGAFVAACSFSLLAGLLLFTGKIMVLPGSAGLDMSLVEPYRLMPESLNQLVYLYLTLLFVYALAELALDQSLARIEAMLTRAVRVSCAVATVVVLWQALSNLLGVWFPAGFFHSDLHSEAWDQGLFLGISFGRLSGSFSEPSALAYFFTFFVFFFWERFRQARSELDFAFFLASWTVMLFSTSSTAYVMSAALIGLILGRAGLTVLRLLLAGENAVIMNRGMPRLRMMHFRVAVVVGMAVLAMGFLISEQRETASALLETQLLNKTSSDSFAVRSNADLMALTIIKESYGLGLGLGSHRPSSGLLAAMVGPGLLGLAILTVLLYQALRRPPGAPNAVHALMQPARWGVIGLVLCHVVTGPELNSLPLWALIALLLAMKLAYAKSSSAQVAGLAAGAPWQRPASLADA